MAKTPNVVGIFQAHKARLRAATQHMNSLALWAACSNPGLLCAAFSNDVRIGIRQMRRSPSFFAIAALLIAIGIAATTQIFTLVDALLLRPLPIKDPENLVQLFEQQAKRPPDPFFEYGFYRDLARHSATLFETAGQMDTTRSLERDGVADRVHDVAVTDNFFRHLGISPLLGRFLRAGDSHVTVLSYAYWSREFGRDPNVLGHAVRMQGHAYTIVGVAPQAFTGTTIDLSPDLWTSFADQLDFSRNPQSQPGSLRYRDHWAFEAWNVHCVGARVFAGQRGGLVNKRYEVPLPARDYSAHLLYLRFWASCLSRHVHSACTNPRRSASNHRTGSQAIAID